MNKSRKSNSIAFKLVIVLILTAVVQSIVMSVLLVAGGVIKHSKNNEHKIFAEKVSGRKDNLENQMIHIWTNFDLYTSQIRQYFSDHSIGPGKELDSDQVLEDLAPVILDALYYTKTTGAFLILDDEAGENGSHPAFYIRNANPDRIDEDKNNLYLLAGPWNAAEKLGVVTDSNWSYSLELNEENRDFYEKPFQSGGLSDESRWLGYWSPPFQVKPESGPVVTYSIPLKSQDGHTIGVFGVEIAVSYLNKYLPASELRAGTSFGYVIGLRTAPKAPVQAVMLNGALQKRILNENMPMDLKLEDEENQIYSLNSTGNGEEIYACLSRMQMYGNNTPFSNEEWFLIGLMDREALNHPTDRIRQTLLVSFFLSLFIGSFIALLTSKWFTSFARVIELSDVSVGVLEMKRRRKRVLMTSQVPELLGLSKAQERLLSRNKSLLQEYLRENCRPAPDEPNIFKLKNAAENCWLRITWKTVGEYTRCVIEDVTEEILHTRALKAERDYDGLTDVKNRRSFERMMEDNNSQLRPDSHICLVMCDLNNLKQVNDEFGHEKGDEYIRYAASALCDSFPIGSVYRVGGDEFIVMVENTSEEEIQNYCGRLNRMFKDFNERMEYGAGVAVGYAFYDPALDEDLYSVRSRADLAMYGNKKKMKEN